MKILVTGGTGFVGKHLIHSLKQLLVAAQEVYGEEVGMVQVLM